MGVTMIKLVTGTILLYLTTGISVLAQQPSVLTATESAEVAELVDQGTPGDLLKQLALAAVPEAYDNTKHWGQTKRRWDGVSISLDGLRLKTKRKWRDVNHGTWKRYRAWLIDPDQEFDLRIENIRPLDKGRIAFEIAIDARLGLFARLSQWQLGVQLVSLSTDAEAVVQLRLACEASMRLDFEQTIPDLVIEPVVTSADLKLVHFDVDRISNLHGPGVEQLGRSLHDVIQGEIDERRPKVVARANHQIEKNRDKLRFSVRKLADNGWGKARELLETL